MSAANDEAPAATIDPLHVVMNAAAAEPRPAAAAAVVAPFVAPRPIDESIAVVNEVPTDPDPQVCAMYVVCSCDTPSRGCKRIQIIQKHFDKKTY